MKTLNEMNYSEALEIFRAFKSGEGIERYSPTSCLWRPTTGQGLAMDCIYRVTVSPITLEWSHLHSKYKVAFKGDSELVYVSTATPYWNGQYFNPTTHSDTLCITRVMTRLKPGNVCVRDSLIYRPEVNA